MARTIVLRFDATCFDCGSPIPAGSAARWFGRGRVSCCGSSPAAPAAGAPSSRSAPAARPSVPSSPRAMPSYPFPSSTDVDRARELRASEMLDAHEQARQAAEQQHAIGLPSTHDERETLGMMLADRRGFANGVARTERLRALFLAEWFRACDRLAPMSAQPLPAVAAAPVPHPELGARVAFDQGDRVENVHAAASATPKRLLFVQLESGARFVAHAEHVPHLLACIVESCRDKVREVTRALVRP